MAKTKTQFGILMNLLDISTADFSDFLHIDRTTISKWRTGRRTLHAQSPYFEQILKYFIMRNEADPRKPLHGFLAQQYPDQAIRSPEQFHDYLKLYLCTPEPEKAENQTPPDAQNSSYRMFVDVDGRRAALDLILTQAEKMAVPGTIKILELEQMAWLCRDITYLQTVIARIKKLAQRNFQIEFAYSSLQSHPTFMVFLSMLEQIRFNKNVNKYIVDIDRVQGILPRVYALSDQCVAVGLDSDDPCLPIHTNLFFDPLNVYKYSRLFDRVVNLYGSKVEVTNSGEEIDRMLQSIDYFSIKKADFLYYGSQLSITTMSQSLLFEILSSNNIQGNSRTRCLTYYQCMRQTMTAVTPPYTSTYYLNLDSLEQSISYDYVIDFELSALTNSQIQKTPLQYKRHIIETVNFLEEHTQINSMLLSGNYQTGNHCAWVKKNLWSLALNTSCVPNEYQVIFCDNTNLVNMAVEVCNYQIKQNYPVEHRQREYNLDVLRALSQGEII